VVKEGKGLPVLPRSGMKKKLGKKNERGTISSSKKHLAVRLRRGEKTELFSKEGFFLNLGRVAYKGCGGKNKNKDGSHGR